MPDFSAWWAPLGLFASFIGLVFIGGWRTRRYELAAVEVAQLKAARDADQKEYTAQREAYRLEMAHHREDDRRELHEMFARMERKLDSLVTAVALVGTASATHAAEMESLRRDVTLMQERTR